MLKFVKKQNRKKTLAVGCLFLVIAVAGCNRALSQPRVYGAKTIYAQGQPLVYPDVTLEFIGTRKMDASAEYPHAITYYDFIVRQGDQAQPISWSAGTGDIAPTSFKIAGQNYWLELAMSDKLGSLAEDELVLWNE